MTSSGILNTVAALEIVCVEYPPLPPEPTTLSPTSKSSTSGPTSCTVPETSIPGVNGGLGAPG